MSITIVGKTCSDAVSGAVPHHSVSMGQLWGALALDLDLESIIKKIESEIYPKITPDLLLELHKLKMKYNELSLEHAKRSLLRLKQIYYEGGEKAGKLLARRIEQLQTERAVHSIQIKEGEITFDQTEINEVFNNNSLHLYSAFLCTQSALHRRGGGSPRPPPVCSIHLDDTTAAIVLQNTPHTPATGGEETE